MSVARSVLALMSCFALATGAPGNAAAQTDYPTHTVKLLVPYAAGGATDLLGRIFAKGLSERLGQAVVVENKAGAATNIAATAVYRAEPDGHTLLLATIASNALNKWTYKKLDYNPDEFAPVSMLGQNTFYLVVSPASPARTVADLVRLGREKPEGLSYGSNGNGSPNQLLAELFKSRTGIKLLHVPYKGSNESNADLMAGRIDFMFDGSAIALVNAGQLRALAVAFPERWPTQPEIPTMAEAGYPDVTVSTFFGIVAPPKTPAAVVDKLNAAVRAVAAESPGLENRMLALGIKPYITTPAEAGAFLKAQSEKWGPVIRSIGISMD